MQIAVTFIYFANIFKSQYTDIFRMFASHKPYYSILPKYNTGIMDLGYLRTSDTDKTSVK